MNGQALGGQKRGAMLAHAQRTRNGRGPPGNRLPAAFPLTALLNGMPAPRRSRCSAKAHGLCLPGNIKTRANQGGQKCRPAQIALGRHATYKEANQVAGKWAYSAYPATWHRLRGGPGCRCQRGRRCLRRQSHSPSFAGSRSSRRSTLPTGDLGRLARNSMREGRL